MLLCFDCPAHMYSCTVYSVQPLYSRQKVLTVPQSESDRGEDQNIVSPRTQNSGDISDNVDLVTSNVSIRIILIHLQTLHHHEQCLAACLPCLRYGLNINYFIFPIVMEGFQIVVVHSVIFQIAYIEQMSFKNGCT